MLLDQTASFFCVLLLIACSQPGLARPRHSDGKPCADEMCTHSEHDADKEQADDGSGDMPSSEVMKNNMDVESMRHGLLMHGDKNAGLDHDMNSHNKKTDTDKTSGQDTLDVDTVRHKLLMHGNLEEDLDHGIASHDTKSITNGKHIKDALDVDNIRHKLLMHGDVNSELDHDIGSHDKKEERQQKKKVLDMDDVRHKILVHGDLNSDVDHDLEDHNKKPSENESKETISLEERLQHGLMVHGDLNADLKHDHEEGAITERRHPKDVRIMPDPNKIRQQYLSRTSNGETLVVQHNEEDQKTLTRVRGRLKNVDFSRISPNDVEEFVNWLVEDEVSDKRFEKMAPEDGGPVIPSSLAEDIEEMKRRYLKQYYEQLVAGDDNDDKEEEGGDTHGADDILDVIDLDESDDEFRDFVDKTKRERARNGL